MICSAVYIACVVLVNYAFDLVPLVALPGGDIWSPVSLAVGFVFVARDFAQREIGHLVLPAMFLGGLLSWLLAGPTVALASVCAFMTGEMLDWAVYTGTRRPFSQRILLSSAVSTPADSAVFLCLMDIFSFSGLALMTLSKMAGAFLVFFLTRRREHSVA
ncbi:MAG: VUT family protein [Desulfovibrio sp.]|jgi:uncharacterized PurR-regulated membrane protein YhhQ (DUF165 family)|nr:VUT family protein [Desulfovibrio sp.]